MENHSYLICWRFAGVGNPPFFINGLVSDTPTTLRPDYYTMTRLVLHGTSHTIPPPPTPPRTLYPPTIPPHPAPSPAGKIGPRGVGIPPTPQISLKVVEAVKLRVTTSRQYSRFGQLCPRCDQERDREHRLATVHASRSPSARFGEW